MDEKVLVEKQHKKGKLYTRERLELLFDKGIYNELTTDETRDGVWVCVGKIAGKKTVVAAQDFTWKGGSLGRVHGYNIVKALDYAIKRKIPFICINDSGGARVQEGIGALAYYGEIFRKNVKASGMIPQICAVLGPCAGGAAYSPAIMDFIFTVKNISQMYITGPKVIKEVIGENVSTEELGGSRIHSHINGNADFEYNSEEECLEGIRNLVGILPRNYKNVQQAEASYKVPTFQFRLPENPKRVYDIHDLINSVFDQDSFVEIKKSFAGAVVIGLAKLNGRTVEVVANNPAVECGVLSCDASDKAARFIRFCDSFSIPLISFTDTPGYMPGKEEEYKGIIRHGAKLLYAFAEASVPKGNIIIRKAFGGAYIAMNSKHLGAEEVFAWPTAEIAVMGAKSAVSLLYGKLMQEMSADEAKVFYSKKMQEYTQMASDLKFGLEQGYIDHVIHPEETRKALSDWLSMKSRTVRGGIKKKHGGIPL